MDSISLRDSVEAAEKFIGFGRWAVTSLLAFVLAAATYGLLTRDVWTIIFASGLCSVLSGLASHFLDTGKNKRLLRKTYGLLRYKWQIFVQSVTASGKVFDKQPEIVGEIESCLDSFRELIGEKPESPPPVELPPTETDNSNNSNRHAQKAHN